jgi:metal-sulfur cluster biosynthetic enzyme
MPLTEQHVYAALREVRDPELMVNIVDLGLIYGVELHANAEKQDIAIRMTMTTPACPYAPELIQEVKDVIGDLEGAGMVEVTVTLDPPWTPDLMTEDARDELGLF